MSKPSHNFCANCGQSNGCVCVTATGLHARASQATKIHHIKVAIYNIEAEIERIDNTEITLQDRAWIQPVISALKADVKSLKTRIDGLAKAKHKAAR